MEFEYDSDKSRGNLKKHGVDFDEARALWEDPDALEIPAKDEKESRWMIIGKMQGKYWSGIFTCRGKKIRIISVRRSRKKEVALYEDESIG